MSRLYKIAIGCFICTVIISYIINELNRQSLQKPLQISALSSFGTEEDPAARARYEFDRLKSPKTRGIPEKIRFKELRFAKTLPSAESLQANELHKAAVFNWRSRGPYNVGGRTRALGLDVNDPTGSTILAGGVSGGIWKSTDKGSTWKQTTDPLTLHNVTSLVQDTRPGKTDTWYYGTGEFRNTVGNITGGEVFNGDGVYRSDDNGESWRLLTSTATNKPHLFDVDFNYVWNIVIDVSNEVEDEVYAATYGGIYKSLNGGDSWTFVLGTATNQSSDSDIVIDDSGVLYAALSSEGTDGGVWRSIDGETWVNITPFGWPFSYNRTVIANAPSNQNVVYFLIHESGSNHGFWKYNYIGGDGTGSGGSWSDRSHNLPVDSRPDNTIHTYDAQSGYNMVIKVYPENENTVFIGGRNLFRSADGFASNALTRHVGGYSTIARNNDPKFWDEHHPDQHALIFSPTDPTVLYSAHDGGISVTNNPLANALSTFMQWKDLNNGYLTTQFYTVAIDQYSTSDLIIGGMQDNATQLTDTDDLKADWEKVFIGDGGYTAIQQNGAFLIVSFQQGFIFRQTRDQTAFTLIKPSQPNPSDYLFITPFILDRNNENLVYLVAGANVYRFDDIRDIPLDGNSFTKSGWDKLNLTPSNSGQITAIAGSQNPANILYIGTKTGEIVRIDNAHAGLSPASTITTLGKGLPSGSEAYISSIAVDPNDGDVVLASYSNYEQRSLFFTDDGGSTWSHVSGNLEEHQDGSGSGPSIRSVGILKWNATNNYFAGTSTGLYSTTILDGENTVWVQEGPTIIGNVPVDMIATRDADGEVVIATHGSGVFSRDFVTSVDDDVLAVPSTINLHQNFPNPFNPSTTIRFELTKPEQVSLTVFNTLGQIVRRLSSSEHFNAGVNTIVFDGRDKSGRQLASGVYFYRLTAGEFVETRKMMLIK